MYGYDGGSKWCFGASSPNSAMWETRMSGLLWPMTGTCGTPCLFKWKILDTLEMIACYWHENLPPVSSTFAIAPMWWPIPALADLFFFRVGLVGLALSC
jgi:hypothetical protein